MAAAWKPLGAPFGKGATVQFFLTDGPNLYACVLTEMGVNLHGSSNGGKSWQLLKRTVDCGTRLKRGMAARGKVLLVAEHGVIQRSQDGGKRWAPVALDKGRRFYGTLGIATIGKAFVVRDSDGALLRSEDGKTWKAYSDKVVDAPGVIDALFAVGSELFATFTDDEGKNAGKMVLYVFIDDRWESLGPKGALLDTFSGDTMVSYGYGSGKAEISVDRGATWIPATFDAKDVDALAGDSSMGLYLAGGGELYRSVDKGQSWLSVGRLPVEGCGNAAVVAGTLVLACPTDKPEKYGLFVINTGKLVAAPAKSP
jgi:photosystem II stability/assembly factor-like uncharacterized protein